MSTIQERIENDKKVDFFAKVVAGDDVDAFEYIKFLATAARIVDDIFDEFHNVSAKQCCCAFEILFVKIPTNKFYRKHQDLLLAHHIAMWNAWEASNILDKGDEVDKIYAHVLRDQVNEILPLIALLTQGHDKMKEINGLIRTLFKKQLGE